jgi:cell wall integrity and stress response component
VGIGMCALAIGFFFFLRMRKKHAVEAEYRRKAEIDRLAGGKPESASSISDSRLEPSVMLHRRESDGSIADNQDYSRRILKVFSLYFRTPLFPLYSLSPTSTFIFLLIPIM